VVGSGITVIRKVLTGLDLAAEAPSAAGDRLPAPVRAEIAPLLAAGAGLFAVVDGARCPGLPELLEGLGLPHASLLGGQAAETIGGAAPFLVALTGRDTLSRWLFAGSGVPLPLWGRNAAILLVSDKGLAGLRAHLRRFTMLQGEDGAWLYFRFFAPATMDGLGRLLAEDAGAAQAFFGDAIGMVLHEVPARDQMAVLTVRGPMPAAAGAPPLRADPRLRGAVGRRVGRTQVETLRLAVEDRLQRRGAALAGAVQALPRSRRFGIAKDLWRAGILDPDAGSAIMAITLDTGMHVMREPAFHYATRNPFLTGRAKARQLIDAYRMVARMKKD
jgi:hypothetical protein